ncbi:cupin domain-containing protein [Dechloromonas denitrificans]|uniref:cupin domain-containing protein n=1 Tax=Dechloromonas denitrificans TaxID=281362 RepID=UPI001CFB3036|nr:cupin domain-containing protein [Dechloromonas denitrificans]UCV06748.1 cupin domain-containing protein [Dechloromonas denitrificans]
MPTEKKPDAVVASEVAPRAKPSNYPEPFASQVAGREKRQLGEVFGLANFGVNLTRMVPGSISALRHSHSKQDEFIYVLEGTPTLLTEAGETQLAPGMCAGFKAGSGGGHQLANRSSEVVVYLEVGDRTAGDSVFYPDDDIEAYLENGGWRFRHKNGQPY